MSERRSGRVGEERFEEEAHVAAAMSLASIAEMRATRVTVMIPP